MNKKFSLQFYFLEFDSSGNTTVCKIFPASKQTPAVVFGEVCFITKNLAKKPKFIVFDTAFNYYRDYFLISFIKIF